MASFDVVDTGKLIIRGDKASNDIIVDTLQDLKGITITTPLLAVVQYNPGTLTTLATASTALVDMDATNLSVAFTVPASGQVLIRAGMLSNNNSVGKECYIGLRNGSSDVAGSTQFVQYGQAFSRWGYSFLVTGLTAGAPVTLKLAFATGSGGTHTAYIGGTGGHGAAVMEVWAA